MLSRDALTQTFGADELRYLDLGDARLKTRAAFMIEQLAAHPEEAFSVAMAHPAATKAAYRFLENEAVTPQAIHTAHRARTLDRIRPLRQVLFIQDMTECDYTTLAATPELGPLACSRHRGYFLHSTLAATPEGVPLGLVDQQYLVRDPETIGISEDRRRREIAEKESRRWLDGVTRSHQDLSPALETITIADREADIYALFRQPRGPNAHLLIRAAQQHRNVRTETDEVSPLRRAVEAVLPEREHLLVPVARRAGQEFRTAVLVLRQTKLQLCPPRRPHAPGVWVHAILVEEIFTPVDVEPICWLLLTTLPVATYDAVVQCVRWYAVRWLIERYHYILKSGCTLEKLQLKSLEALQRAQALYSIVAWRVLALTYLGRVQPDAPCTDVLSDLEWQVLAAAACPTCAVPSAPPTIRQAIRWVAQLGGFQGRRGDGEPGAKTIWRGLRRLDTLVQGYYIAQRLNPPLAKPHFVGNG